MAGLGRINNAIEGWHRGFQSPLDCSHPLIWKLMSALHREEALQATALTHADQGRPVPKKMRTCIKNGRIMTILDQLLTGGRTSINATRAHAHCFQF